MKVLLNSKIENLHKKKQTLKLTIVLTKPKGIAYKFEQKKMPHTPFPWRRKVGQAKVF
jgi:hypothetical protein